MQHQVEELSRSRIRAGAIGLVVAACTPFLVELPAVGAQAESRTVGVVDLHVDLSYQINYKSQSLARGSGQYTAAALLSSGVQGVVLPLFIPREASPQGPRLQDFENSYQTMIAALKQTQPYSLPGCELPDHVRTWFSFEGSAPFAGVEGEIGRWVSRGAVLFGLMHTYDNVLGTSAGKGPAVRQVQEGLSDSGRRVAERVMAEGGILDVSHASDTMTRDMVQLAIKAGKPIVASHSDARTVTPHARNLPDDLAALIAQSGGVIGVNFHSPFLSTDPSGATVHDVVRHIRHWVSKVGIDHVAIGSDFEGDIRPAKGLEDVRGFRRLTSTLKKAGFSPDEIRKIMGLNALRVLCSDTRHRAVPQCQ